MGGGEEGGSGQRRALLESSVRAEAGPDGGDATVLDPRQHALLESSPNLIPGLKAATFVVVYGGEGSWEGGVDLAVGAYLQAFSATDDVLLVLHIQQGIPGERAVKWQGPQPGSGLGRSPLAPQLQMVHCWPSRIMTADDLLVCFAGVMHSLRDMVEAAPPSAPAVAFLTEHLSTHAAR